MGQQFRLNFDRLSKSLFKDLCDLLMELLTPAFE
jgi:hypothetical protein